MRLEETGRDCRRLEEIGGDWRGLEETGRDRKRLEEIGRDQETGRDCGKCYAVLASNLNSNDVMMIYEVIVHYVISFCSTCHKPEIYQRNIKSSRSVWF